VIELHDIVKIYRVGDEDTYALNHVSLTIKKGEFVAIMGSSGSGKSSLMNILGLLDKPSSGDYLLDGVDVSTISKGRQARIRNQKIGFVFQQFNLMSRTSVIDNILLPTIYGRSKQAGERARLLIDKVGLTQRSHHLSNQLSGGQIQRVAIARALIMQPSLVLADEPTGNLDSKRSHEIMQLFRDVNKQEGATIVVITHEPDVARFADRTIHIKDGELIESKHSVRNQGPKPSPKSGQTAAKVVS
jgi:ABC-type lipoprotein export system ATPase subunit